MKALFIGDIVGQRSAKLIAENIRKIKTIYQAQFCIANGENIVGGKGINKSNAEMLQAAGIDLITSGNHIWNSKTKHILKEMPEYVLRPANYPSKNYGKGIQFIRVASQEIAIVNLIGRTFMNDAVDSPFQKMDDELSKIRVRTKNIFVDFHAETSSEKQAMGWFLDGKVTAVLGTHTHVQTADERVLTSGTAYITDLGMTGPYDSVIGMNKDKAIERFYLGIPNSYDIAEETNISICGVCIDFDEDNGKANSIERIKIHESKL